VNHPISVHIDFGVLTFEKIAYYRNLSSPLVSPPELDYLQIFTIITIIYVVLKIFLLHRKTNQSGLRQ
jgi:hypothetical protein